MFLFCKEYLLLSVAEQTIKTKLSFLKRNVLSLLGKKIKEDMKMFLDTQLEFCYVT